MDNTYAIIIDGEGNGIYEYKLGKQVRGNELTSTIVLENNNIINNMRIVLLMRNITGLNNDYYTFPTKVTSIPMIDAFGPTTPPIYPKSDLMQNDRRNILNLSSGE